MNTEQSPRRWGIHIDRWRLLDLLTPMIGRYEGCRKRVDRCERLWSRWTWNGLEHATKTVQGCFLRIGRHWRIRRVPWESRPRTRWILTSSVKSSTASPTCSRWTIENRSEAWTVPNAWLHLKIKKDQNDYGDDRLYYFVLSREH